jgi:hypothetical protein
LIGVDGGLQLQYQPLERVHTIWKFGVSHTADYNTRTSFVPGC